LPAGGYERSLKAVIFMRDFLLNSWVEILIVLVMVLFFTGILWLGVDIISDLDG
jgi:hypothetical protein